MITYFINNPKVSGLIAFTIIIAGIMSMGSMRRESYPNVDFARATVTTHYPGATPEDVEVQITTKIEDEIREIDGIKKIRSTSQEALSEIKITVDMDNFDQQIVLGEIQRAVDRVTDLPAELPNPPLFEELKTANRPVYEVSVTGDINELELRKIADQLEDVFELIPGISNINKIGYREREYRVFVDPEKMEFHHIGFNDIIQSIQARNISKPGGIFESRPYEMSVRTIGEFNSSDELLDVVIRTNLFGQAVKIKDIATISDTFEQPKVLTKTNGKPSIVLVASKKEMADIIKVTAQIKESLVKFKETLPAEVSLITSSDESVNANNRLKIIISNSLIGFTLLMLSLILFLNLKTSIITSLSVPVVILCTLTIMNSMDITFNLMSMLAIVIALGMFVDNSIVISENIFRLRQEGLSIHEAAIQGTREIAAPITATVLTTIAAFAPMLVTTGVMGQFIWAIPAIVSCSLLASLGESFFLLPTRIIAFGKTSVPRELTWFTKLQYVFEKILGFILKYKWVSIFTVTLLLIGSILFAMFRLDFVLFSPEGVEKFIVKYQAHPGTPIEEVHQAISDVEQTLMALPDEELLAITTRTGIQQTEPGDPLARVGDNIGMILVYLKPENERQRIADEIITELRKQHPVTEPFQMIQIEKMVNGPPVGKPVTVSVQGPDLDILKTIAKDITKFLASIDGITDINQDLKPGLKQLRVNMKESTTEEIGLTVADVANALRTAHEGVVASTVRKYEDDIDIRVLFSSEARGNRGALENILISDKRGNLVLLSDVATIVEEDGPEHRRHFNYRRAITIAADVDTNTITSVVANAKLAEEFSDLPTKYPGYALHFGGEGESTKESMASLARAMTIAVIGIFVILVALFGSFSKPLLIMFAIPFGFIGTILGFAIHGKALGFLAMIGIIGLAGVVVNAAIVLVSFIERLRIENPDMSLNECLVKGASMRLRPILLTTLTTISALFPTAYGLGGYDPMLVPVTLAMAWGLLFGTGLTLIIIPCGYAVLDDILNLFNRNKAPSKE